MSRNKLMLAISLLIVASQVLAACATPRLPLYTLADKTFQFIPSAADGDPTPLTQEGDFWVSEVKIKPGIAWSDGTPWTANDVAFTANTALTLQLPGNWSSAYDFNFLDHVEAVDDTTG